MKNINVVKYDGSIKPFELNKIKKMISYYSEGLDINPLELESKISVKFRDMITTKEIQEVIEHTAMIMATPEQPDYAILAGRSVLYNLYKVVKKNTGIDVSDDFFPIFKYNLEHGIYDNSILDNKSLEELEGLNGILDNERDRSTTVASAKSLVSKYLTKNKNGVTEYPQSALLATVAYLNQYIESDIFKTEATTDYEYLSKKILSLATPFRSNLRKLFANLSSCFIIEAPDSLEGILKAIGDAAKISKLGGGVGIYLGKIRPEDAILKGLPVANNIIRWVAIFNAIAKAVDQLGTRNAALTLAIDAWHLDVESFIEVKTEVGELRDKSFDIFPQVVITDEFLRRRDERLDWYLFDSKEIIDELHFDLTESINFTEDYNKCVEAADAGVLKHFKVVKANDLWKRFLTVYVETGDFYLTQRDKLNFCNPAYKSGMVSKCYNLCTESSSPFKASSDPVEKIVDDKIITTRELGYSHTCNLLSINMAEILNDEELFIKAIRRSVRILNKALRVTNTPIPESKKHNDIFATIGIGTVGVSDWMAYNKLSYLKEEDHEEIEKIYEKIQYYAYDESCNIAIEQGHSFKAYDQTSFKDGYLIGKPAEELQKNSKVGLDWVGLSEKIQANGIANMLLVAVAPNTGTGALMGVGSSYLPVFSRFFYEEFGKLLVPVPAKFIKDRFWYYNEGSHVPTEKIINLTNRVSYWIDTGISMELVINPNITNIKNISDALVKGFKENLKSMYYCRVLDVADDGSIIEDPNSKKKSTCVACKN